MIIAFNIGYKVMLLTKMFTQYKLVNGSIGSIEEIMFKHMDRNNHMTYELLICFTIEFKETYIDEESEWRINLDKIYIPIVLVTIRCARKYCTITSIPLMLCKVITIHKSYGMNIRHCNPFKSVIVYSLKR